MKNILSLFIILLLVSCSEQKLESNTFELLPSTQQFSINSGESTLDASALQWTFSAQENTLPIRYGVLKNLAQIETAELAQIHFSINYQAGQQAESYSLKIEEEKIRIEAQDEAGLFYAFVTLSQIIDDAQGQALPILEINDAPKIAFRPIQIDIKHHREKKTYYYELMDHLAQLKINGVILEIEDKLQYKRRPEVGSEDAMTIEQWKAISKYAHERNINISPLVQGLGHASFVLKHEINFPLRDDPRSDWAFNPLDPKTYELQFDLYLDAMEAFPYGKYLHVGGDEVKTTGRNSGMSSLELNLIWLNKVSAFAAEHNRIPIFWDDMPLKEAGLMSPIYDSKISEQTVDSIWAKNELNLNQFITQFPKNCVYMRWNYHMAESYGNGKAMDWFSSNGFNVMGATAGQTRWTLMPQRESNIDQIKIFARQSIDRNYNGLLLTLWDDDSPHFELYKRGIAAFAEYSWAGMKRTKEEFKTSFRHRTFGASFESEDYAFIDALDKPVALWTNVLLEEGIHRNSLVHRENVIEQHVIDLPDFNDKGAWAEKYADRLENISEQSENLKKVKKILSKLKSQDATNQYTIAIYEQVGALVEYNFKALKKIEAFDLAITADEEIKILFELQELIQKFGTFRQEFEKVYSQTRILNKPENYILDQDHHNHPANQSVNFDWQFISEILFLEKVNRHFKTKTVWQEGTNTILN